MDTEKDRQEIGIVRQIFEEGPHGPYFLAECKEKGFFVTVSLEEDVWKENSCPEGGSKVVISDIRGKEIEKKDRGKETGWRGYKARFFRPSDEKLFTKG